MVDKGLITYIQQNLKAGYTKEQIREVLLKAGYDIQTTEEGLKEATKKGIPIIPIIAFFIIIIFGVTLFFLITREKPPEFQLITSTMSSTINAGESFNINMRLLNHQNIGQINFNHKLIDEQAREIVSYNQNSQATGVINYMFSIPEQTREGNYIIRTTTNVNNKEYSSTFNINIRRIEEIDDEEIEQPIIRDLECINCDDFNPCTKSECINGRCVHTPITPCCGNYICERGEDYFNCPQDCYPIPPSELEIKDEIDIAKEKAITSPQEAFQDCKKIILQERRDSCLFAISDIAGKIDYCEAIESDSIRDNCYTKAGLLRGDTSVCPKITNRYMRESCLSMTNI